MRGLSARRLRIPALLASGFVGFAHGQEPAPQRDADRRPATANTERTYESLLHPDSVRRRIESGQAECDALLPGGPFDVIVPHWRGLNESLEESVGLELGLAYTVLYQSTFGAAGDSPAAGGDLDLHGHWTFFESDEGEHQGTLVFALEYRHQIGDRTPAALSEQYGGLGESAFEFDEISFSLAEFFWEQRLFDEAVVVSIGKLFPETLYNTNRLSNQNTSFVHSAFATNIARSIPEEGLGANVVIKPHDSWYASLGVHDVHGEVETGDFRHLDEGDTSAVIEFGLTPHFENGGRGNYRFTAWATDPREDRDRESDTGFALSFDQSLGEHATVFARYSTARADWVEADHVLAGGVGFTGVLGRPDDFVGLAFGWTSPRESELREEYVSEALYRVQLTDVQQLSAGLQLIFDPAESTDDDVVAVFEARWRVAF